MLKGLLNPESIAVIGASKTPGKVGNDVLNNLLEGGFEGSVIPINPTAEEILGQKCYPSLKKYGKSVEMCVITVPAFAVKDAVTDSVHAGAKSVVVITAGFKEVSEEGAQLEKDIAAICRKEGVRLLGPNVLGLINTYHKMNASFAHYMPKPGGISVISQSGAVCTAILDWAASRHLGLAKLISVGNKADITEIDLLRELADDDETKVIVAYLESISDGKEFIRVAEQVTTKKPVVIFKAGTTTAGVKAASSHTGSLAGTDMAYGAAFQRSGVIRAETFEQLFDFSTALAMQPMPKGNRVAIVTNAGGPGIIAADSVENAGLEVAELDWQTAAALKQKLPDAASVGNPIDVLGDADPDRYRLAITAAMEADTVDSVIVILTPQAMTKPAETAKMIAGCSTGKKPLLACFMGGRDVIPARRELVAHNLPDYASPERAVASLKAMRNYAAWQDRPPRIVTRFPVNRRRVARLINRHIRMQQVQIGEIDAKKILDAYDFKVPKGAICTSAEEAVEAGLQFGFPLAMKIYSPDIIHKSDVGGVKLNLQNAEQVRDAFDLMMLRIGRAFPDARLDGVYIETMAPRGREVIVGMHRDPQFGPMLMFGLGGIFVEVMKDVTFHLAPITEDEAMQMLKGTRSFSLLKGVRGQTGVDMRAIARGLQHVSQLATDFPQITELDINPFIVGSIGVDAVAADARITIQINEK